VSSSSKKTPAKKTGGQSARQVAISVLEAVLVKGRSLATARSLVHDKLEARERPLAMELVNGVLRWRFRLEALLAKLLSRPLRKKDVDIQLALLLALYELIELSTPDYAVVNEAVTQTRRVGKKWASGMVNGVLRSFIRDREALLTSIDEDEVARFSHPRWLIDLLKQDWPQQTAQILDANNQRPPMWLRVNAAKTSVEDYMKRLDAQQIKAVRHPLADVAVKLESPMDVSHLPGFTQGLVSVQDAAAQLAAKLLGAENGERVLDLCAAPGGKTCHLLESAANIEMTAVELEPLRMQRVQQNLDRLGLHAELIVGDATDTQSWWDGRTFDRILVDAPCSASGVIRRHPDIKSLRHVDDLDSLTKIQQQILLQALSMLKPGGTLLYVTCSVLKRENEQQIAQLMSVREEAVEIDIDETWGIPCAHGRQLLPGDMDGDGFYYARLKKQDNP
jgi:16S rRNA (cytosine967-C5)-methyltransferase